MPNGVAGLDIFYDQIDLEYGNGGELNLGESANGCVDHSYETTGIGPPLNRLAPA